MKGCRTFWNIGSYSFEIYTNINISRGVGIRFETCTTEEQTEREGWVGRGERVRDRDRRGRKSPVYVQKGKAHRE